jgi:hypothetical protein
MTAVDMAMILFFTSGHLRTGSLRCRSKYFVRGEAASLPRKILKEKRCTMSVSFRSHSILWGTVITLHMRNVLSAEAAEPPRASPILQGRSFRLAGIHGSAEAGEPSLCFPLPAKSLPKDLQDPRLRIVWLQQLP